MNQQITDIMLSFSFPQNKEKTHVVCDSRELLFKDYKFSTKIIDALTSILKVMWETSSGNRCVSPRRAMLLVLSSIMTDCFRNISSVWGSQFIGMMLVNLMVGWHMASMMAAKRRP